MKKSQVPRRVANVFGALGYMSCVIQWMMVFAVLVLPVMENDSFRDLFMPSGSTHSTSAAGTVELPPILQQLLVVVAVIFSVSVTVYALVAIPRSIGKAGRRVTHRTAEVAVQQISHIQHKPLSQKQQKTLAERLTWTIKLLLTLIPLALLLIPVTPRFAVTHEYVLVGGAFCGAVTLLWFGIQYIVSRFARLDPRDVW